MPKNAATWSSPRWRSSGTRRRVRRTVQRGLLPGAGTPAATHSAARKRQSNRALWATNTPASSAYPRPATTSTKRGRPATRPSVMPVRRVTHGGIGVPGSSNASKARWMVPPSRIATATSRIRPPFCARTPVVSTSTTAKRACSRDSGPGLEVIPPEWQRHAAGTAAAAHQLAPVHRDHRPLTVVQRLLTRQQVHGGDRLEPRMLELPQRGLVAGVGDRHAGPHREEIAGRGPLLALLQRAVRAPAERRLERVVHRLHGGEEVGHLLHPLRFLAAVQHGEPLRPDEMRRIDAAQLAVELRKNHVQVDRGALVREDHADHVPHIAREEEIGKRRQREAGLVERAGDRPGVFQGALDHQADERLGREGGELLRQGVRRHHLERAGHEEHAHVRTRHQLRQERAHLVHLGEPLQHRHEPPVLALGELQVDDVVVQIVFPVSGSDGDQLAAGGMYQHRPQRADFRGDVDAGHGRNLTVRNGEFGMRNVNVSVAQRTTSPANSAFRIPHSALVFHRFANAKLSVSSSSAIFTDFTATSPGTASCTGAKLRMAFTPARTSRSTTSCADSAGVTTMAMSLGSLTRSASRWRMSRTTRPFQREPIFFGSLSYIAATWKPRCRKPGYCTSALPMRPAPTSTTR